MEAERAKELAKKKEFYRKCLEDQIYFNAVRRQDAYQQFLREKQIIDEIARALREEEFRYLIINILVVVTVAWQLLILNFIC